MNPESPSKRVWKGKAKATEVEEDYYDLNPTITYRHLLSQNMGVRDPLRVIALCDSDAFYASCEMVRLGIADDVSLVVLQWDSLIAVNYPARKFGISRMDKKQDALKRCPHLKIVHVATYKEGEKEPGYWEDVDTNTHKVSLDHYRRESLKIFAMFRDGLPGCEVEKASIDEIFIDFTQPVRKLLLMRYPHLSLPPENAQDGADTPLPEPPGVNWDGLGTLIPINRPPPEPSNVGDHASADHLKLDLPAAKPGDSPDTHKATWHDVALSIAAELMGKVREEVRVKLGYSTSAGISRNKFLAKLTASNRKPNAQSILRNAAIPSYLEPMPFQKIRFLGGKLGGALAKEFDAATVGDLQTVTLDEMQQKFGESAIWIFEILRGVDRNEVKDKGSSLNKSMLASKNLPKPITKPSEGHHWIRVLAAELALRLKDARNLAPNLWPKSLVLHARKGYEAGRSKQAPFPFVRDVTVDTIASAGDKLWKELIGTSKNLHVSSVQLAFTGIEESEAGQRNIESFLKPNSAPKRPRESEGRTRQLEEQATDVSQLPNSEEGQPLLPSHTCTRCGKELKIPRDTKNLSYDDQEAALAKIQVEHDDYHFAKDLASEGVSRPIKVISGETSNQTSAKPTKRQKRAPERQGIERFFRR